MFNTLLEHLSQKLWNLIVLELKAADMVRPSLESIVSKSRSTENNSDSIGPPSYPVRLHLLNAYFISHFLADIPRLPSFETDLALARRLLCSIHHSRKERWRGIWQLDVALPFQSPRLKGANLLTLSPFFLLGPR